MTVKIRKALKSAAGRAAELAGVVARRSRSSMTIVAFHRVNDEMPEDGITCGSQKLSAFCRFFLENFRVVTLAEQIDGCRRGLDVSGTLSVTFDDGYLDNFTVAAPILEQMGIPATFFVTTGFVGSSLVAPWDGDVHTPQKWMDWDQVRQLASRGFDIGSHTDRHPNLSTTMPSEVKADLESSRRTFERELGVPPRFFAYPFGGPNDISEGSRHVVRELGFDCCLSCFGGVNPVNSDPYRLRRIGIGEWFATPHQFALEYILGRV
jgi:peptidoglycan/xylan/chitin deacetylase (PgdA/CDA1 family)